MVTEQPNRIEIEAAPMDARCPHCERTEAEALSALYTDPFCVPCALRGQQRAAFILRNANRVIDAIRSNPQANKWIDAISERLKK